MEAARTIGGLGHQVGATVRGELGHGQGETYRLRGRWPEMQQLDYVTKLATASLLTLGFLVLLAYALANPRGAGRLVIRGARARAGV